MSSIIDFDQARMDSYELSDAEVTRLDQLVQPFYAALSQEFGPRRTQALANVLGTVLSHILLTAEGPYILLCINEWLATIAHERDGPPVQLTFSEELAANIADDDSNELLQ
jgi:hypothetical protein